MINELTYEVIWNILESVRTECISPWRMTSDPWNQVYRSMDGVDLSMDEQCMMYVLVWVAYYVYKSYESRPGLVSSQLQQLSITLTLISFYSHLTHQLYYLQVT